MEIILESLRATRVHNFKQAIDELQKIDNDVYIWLTYKLSINWANTLEQ